MKRIAKFGLAAIGGVLLLGVAIIVWFLTHADIDESSGPTSREVALQHVSITLPPSAHDVQYASYACGLQDGEFYVRFEAPVSDCRATAEAIFAERAKAIPRSVVPTFEFVSHPQRAGSRRLHTGWFDTDHISKGVVAGTGYGWEPRIWIDEERGVLYFQDRD